jgi:uncharacterized protein
MNYKAASEYILGELKASLPDYCHYHSTWHTQDVLAATERLAKEEGITDERQLILLRTAAVYHDCGFIKQYAGNEPVAAAMAQEILPKYGYSEEDTQVIARLILVTMLGAEPTDSLEQIIKDADFDYLGREDYEPISLMLKEEWEAIGLKYSVREWYELQRKFLSGHRYYTDTAQRDRQPIKEKHIAKIVSWLDKN